MQLCYDEGWIRANPELCERRIQESINSRRPAATIQLQQRAIGGYDVRKQLPSIPKSLAVLIIHGKRDVSVYPNEMQDLMQGIKHAQVLQCPKDDFGHNW